MDNGRGGSLRHVHIAWRATIMIMNTNLKIRKLFFCYCVTQSYNMFSSVQVTSKLSGHSCSHHLLIHIKYLSSLISTMYLFT